MEEIITEKKYPIQTVWILKPALSFIVFIPFLPFLLLGSLVNSEAFFDFLFIIIFYFLYTVLAIANRKFFHFFIEDKFLIVKQGIISKKQRTLPYGVIQNIFIKQDIFDRIFGLASLAVENASMGGINDFRTQRPKRIFGIQIPISQNRQQYEVIGSMGNKINIPGLKKQDAEALKEIVLQKMKENPIEDSQSGL